jgi:hypothetical protein
VRGARVEEHSRRKWYCSFLESFGFGCLFLLLRLDRCAGYGGALSVYFGLSAGLRLLSVSFFRIALQNNAFASCVVSIDAEGGNAYGGGVSLYIGGYSSVFSSNGDAAAAVGDTVARNVSVTLDSAKFESCSAMRKGFNLYGANVYGGSFSFYIGAYSWSRSAAGGNSGSTCGATTVSGVLVRVQSTSSLDSEASATTFGGVSDGANVYGGSMSVLYVGAYAWSSSEAASSMCGKTSASGVSLQVSDYLCLSCSASSSSGGNSFGANSYGGSMSVLYVGAYAWSFSFAVFSSSSRCEATSTSGVSVQVSDSACSNCSVLSSSGDQSYGTRSYGGSMSVLYVGAYAWSFSEGASGSSSSRCEVTSASGISVQVSDSACSSCRALSSNGLKSFGANSYGGSISASYIGAFSYSAAAGDHRVSSRSFVDTTRVHNLSITIKNVTISGTEAVSGEYYIIHLILLFYSHKLT